MFSGLLHQNFKYGFGDENVSVTLLCVHTKGVRQDVFYLEANTCNGYHWEKVR